MITIFLGAGFSRIAGIPLASQLFEERPNVDKITRKKLVAQVVSSWENWYNQTKGTSEQFLAYLEKQGSTEWRQAVWYVALAITIPLASVEYVGAIPTIIRHNINRTTNDATHENFWTTIFKKTEDVTVITTNYDILAERGLRHEPRPRIHRPGFNYGCGEENLIGGGYPSYTHIRPIRISGKVPLIKLHGSISWAVKNGKLIHYHDCRPAIRGDAAILAPITEKEPPSFLQTQWDQASKALSASNKWIIVGYSLPFYDLAIQKLFLDNSNHKPEIHLFDPNNNVAKSFAKLLPDLLIKEHEGLPNGISELDSML